MALCDGLSNESVIIRGKGGGRSLAGHRFHLLYMRLTGTVALKVISHVGCERVRRIGHKRGCGSLGESGCDWVNLGLNSNL